jgi:hypothetical protein
MIFLWMHRMLPLVGMVTFDATLSVFIRVHPCASVVQLF